VAARKDLIDDGKGWERYSWKVDFLAVEKKVLVLVAEDKRRNPRPS